MHARFDHATAARPNVPGRLCRDRRRSGHRRVLKQTRPRRGDVASEGRAARAEGGCVLQDRCGRGWAGTVS
eukprot:357557-Chlamydomonas_euryale.AAC.3